ncbi:MAG: hypothetical protein RR397_05310 [Odoribacter sp.]
MTFRLFICLLGCTLLTSCASWYQRTLAFQTAVQKGEFEQAEKILQKDKKQAKNKNKILYYLNQGYVEFMLGNAEKSNQALETAEKLTEDQDKNILTEAAVLISNPEIRPYKPEDFEVIMINFYKALNYLQMNNMEDALVEVRKINIHLHQLNDKYPDHKNRYQQDAFAQLLMGLIYDAAGDMNNAFIAYRNSYDIYQGDYLKNFNIAAPEQLKKDLLRTASLCGFRSELREYEKTFGFQYVPESPSSNGQLVLFWLNGFGPIKTEWGLTFTKIQKGDGAIVFHNKELGLAFPFFWNAESSESDRNSLSNVNVVRVVFPKYTERPLTYNKGALKYDHKTYSLQIAEDINQIASKTLHDRMVRELSNSLLRVAVKQGLRYAASKENEWLGLAVGLTNAFTEKADTRNWQTLPASISYSRVPLASPENQIELNFTGSKGAKDTQQLTIPANNKSTRFFVYSTL